MMQQRFELKIVYAMDTITKRWGFSVYRIGAGLVGQRSDRRGLLDLLRAMLPLGNECTPFAKVDPAEDRRAHTPS
jgi:hypothetical protein